MRAGQGVGKNGVLSKLTSDMLFIQTSAIDNQQLSPAHPFSL